MTRAKLSASFWILLVLVAGACGGLAFVRHSGWVSWCPVIAVVLCAGVMPQATARVCGRIARWARRLGLKGLRILVGVGYFVLFVPVGLVQRASSKGDKSAATATYWIDRERASSKSRSAS